MHLVEQHVTDIQMCEELFEIGCEWVVRVHALFCCFELRRAAGGLPRYNTTKGKCLTLCLQYGHRTTDEGHPRAKEHQAIEDGGNNARFDDAQSEDHKAMLVVIDVVL